MMSLVEARKRTVGFEAPAITEPVSDSESDSNDDPLKSVMKKAKELTIKRRLQRMVGDAVQLDRRNTVAFRDFSTDKESKKQTRLNKMRMLAKKGPSLPKMAEIVRSASDKPLVKFRRMARAVLLLIQVCHVCKNILSEAVKKEPWYALIDNLIAKSTIQQKRKAPRAFVTFVPNEKRELVQLTFDVAEFKRERRTEFILTDAVREMMSVLPGYRTPQQVAEIIGVLKVLFTSFSHYKLPIQKAIGQLAFYDKYKANRVIVKKGHEPDGVYFILAGCVVEKHEGGKQPKLINAGEKFGEGDLICGNKRRHTVLTKVDSEIFFLHRVDYRTIFYLSDDRNNPKNLDICKQHIVFQHFPMNRLKENPGTWSVNSYKYGELIAKDLHDIDWIYVIKSGEARVLKYLHPNNIDIKARRRKVQAMINSQSPFYRKKRILSFVEEREYIKSAYRSTTYHPKSASSRLGAHTAPLYSAARHRTPLLPDTSVSLPATRQGARPVTVANPRKNSTTKPDVVLPRLVLDNDDDTPQAKDTEAAKGDVSDHQHQGTVVQETVERLPDNLTIQLAKEHAQGDSADEDQPKDDGEEGHKPDDDSDSQDKNKPEDSKLGSELAGAKRFIERRLSTDMTGGLFDKTGPGGRRQSIFVPPDPAPTQAPAVARKQAQVTHARAGRTRGRSASFLKTPVPPSHRSTTPSRNKVIQVGNHTLPAFVQVDTMHPGQVFGLRACLDPEERGPSVSLVSGECEVLQINKKFFMRHCDEAIISLIRLKNKPFPSEEDLIDRLDINMQWEEYKQDTLHSFLKECRSAR